MGDCPKEEEAAEEGEDPKEENCPKVPPFAPNAFT
jgi:hypothetical protein